MAWNAIVGGARKVPADLLRWPQRSQLLSTFGSCVTPSGGT